MPAQGWKQPVRCESRVMDWIKLTEKKPPLNTPVLIFRQGYNIYDAHYYTGVDIAEYRLPQGQREDNGGDPGGFTYDDVVCWMPILESAKNLSKSDLVRMYAGGPEVEGK